MQQSSNLFTTSLVAAKLASQTQKDDQVSTGNEVPSNAHVPAKFGDIIYLSHCDLSRSLRGFLHADGLVAHDVGLQHTQRGRAPSNFSHCLFRLCPMLNYDANHQFGRIHRQHSFSRMEVQGFKARAEQENKRNALILEQLGGPSNDSALHFGHTCQLQVG